MMLDELLLQKLADGRSPSARQTVTVEHADAGWRVDLQADAVESLGGRYSEVTLTRTAPATPVPVKEQGERIAARVTGLLEPLRLVEVDGGRDLAQLRSDAPARRGEELCYYEVLRQGDGTTSVRRYQQLPGAKRQAVAFTLTHEALAKLVRDLAE